MAIRTSVGSGLWSVAGTWNTGVPVDGDSAVIAVGHTVTFDVNQSAWVTGLIGLTITGTFQAQTTAGTYYLKMAGQISGAGSFLVGSVGVPYPSTAAFTCYLMNASAYIDRISGLTVAIYCARPTYRYVRLTQPAGAGDTTLNIDTDVTGDLWAATQEVAVCDINKNREVDRKTIQSITATTIVLTAPVGNAKLLGSFVVLINRNTRITAAVSVQVVQNNFAGTCILDCLIDNGYVGGGTGGISLEIHGIIYSTATSSIGSGTLLTGVIITSGYAMGSITAVSYIIEVRNALLVGCGTAFGRIRQLIISNTIIAGCTTVFNTNVCDHFIDSEIIGCGNSLAFSTIIQAANITTSGGTTDVNEYSYLIGRNITFGSTTQVATPGARTNLTTMLGTVVYDIGGVPGAYKAWYRGGRVVSDPTVPHSPLTQTMKHIFDRIDGPTYTDWVIWCPANYKTKILVHMIKDANGMTETPRSQIFYSENDPAYGGTAIQENIMVDDLSWQVFSCSVKPTYDRQVTIRTRGINAANNFWSGVYLKAGGGGRVVSGPPTW